MLFILIQKKNVVHVWYDSLSTTNDRIVTEIKLLFLPPPPELVGK